METSLKTGFAQIFSCCPKKLSCPKFGGAAAPLAPPRPVRLWKIMGIKTYLVENISQKMAPENSRGAFFESKSVKNG